jgi:O-antigen ligase
MLGPPEAQRSADIHLVTSPRSCLMFVVALISALAALVWLVAYARWGSLLVGCAVLLVVGYVLGYEYWHGRLGPIPLTLDRIVIVGLVAAFGAQWRWHKLDPKPLALTDWAVGLLLLVFAASTVLNLGGQANPNSAPPLWRLVAGFCIPTVLYWISRQSRIDLRSWTTLLVFIVGLGAYLTITALAETAQQWWAVVPRYIANPDLGLHFGRARGPQLNSASLGVYLTAAICCAWTLRSHVSRRWQLVLLAMIPLMAVAVFLTYTRSTWLGLATSGFVVLWLSVPRQWRLPVTGSVAMAALLLVVVAWSQIVGLRREGSAAESQHSVQQRTAFAYVSWQMFKDHPIWGVGFGRFYDRKLPYLSDRSQKFELESLRSLDHHNTLLSVMVETGMVGTAALLAVGIAWGWHAWRLAHVTHTPHWLRSHGRLMVALMAAYLPTALFHDITLLPTEMTLLFVMAGVTVGLTLVAGRELAPCMDDEPRVWRSPATQPTPSWRSSFGRTGG